MNKTPCSDLQQTLFESAWSGEPLKAGEIKHLDGCAPCRAYHAAQVAGYDEARANLAGRVSPFESRSVADAVLQKTTRAQRASSHRAFGAIASFAAVVALGAFFVLSPAKVAPPSTQEINFKEVSVEVLQNMDAAEKLELLEIYTALESMKDV